MLLPTNSDIFFKKHHPTILINNPSNNPVGFKSLCAKELWFIPAWHYYGWLQLQNDFDAFCNKIRSKFICQYSLPNKSNTVLQSHHSLRSRSYWKAPKSNSPELKTFSQNFFEQNQVMKNIAKDERKGLTDWRKTQLFNLKDDLVLQS